MVNPLCQRTARRRVTLCLGMLLGAASWLAGSAGLAKDRFPYTVYTLADDVPVMSGPGESFYATDLLPAGTPVEVHKRETGGWLAIRPPEKSFSWVPARKLHVAAGDRSARVVGDDTVSWIGSRVETVEDHRWQVALERGERVSILGRRELHDEKKGTTETWYQITPPAGEFRWIHAQDVQRHPPADSEQKALSQTPRRQGMEVAKDTVSDWTSKPRGGGEPSREGERDAVVASTALESEAVEGREAAQALGMENRATGAGPDGAGVERDSRVAPVQYRGDWSPRKAPRQARRSEPATLASVDVPLPTSSPLLERELEDLTLQLTQLSAQEPGLWNLAPLRARAETLVDRGSSPLERGKARLMLEKIEEFEELQQRHIRAERGLSLPSLPPATGEPAPLGGESPVGTGLASLGLGSLARTLTGTSSSTAAGGAAEPRIEPRFDGTGWLLPVHSTKRVAPPFALIDDQGKVLQYVTPSPGLNLHRYERKRVGLYGTKGTVATLNAPHLTAHRIVDLDRHAPRTQ